MDSALYDLNRVACLCMGVQISGYGDGGVSISKESEEVERSANADGSGSVYSKINDRVYVVTIELNPHTSQAHRLLDEQVRLFRSDRNINRRFFLRDPGNGDKISSRICVVKKVPDIVKAKSAGMVTWEFFIEPEPDSVIRGGSL